MEKSKMDLMKAMKNAEYDKTVVLEMIDKHPDLVKTLLEVKGPNGQPLFDALAVDDILFNCRDTIEYKPLMITAILSSENAMKNIATWKNPAAGLWRMSLDPTNEVEEAYQKLDREAHLKERLIDAMKDADYDHDVVIRMIDRHPDLIKTLLDVKGPNGKPLFNELAVDDILFNCRDTIKEKPLMITAILNNENAMKNIATWKNPAAGLWRMSLDPTKEVYEAYQKLEEDARKKYTKESEKRQAMTEATKTAFQKWLKDQDKIKT